MFRMMESVTPTDAWLEYESFVGRDKGMEGSLTN